MVVRKLLCNFAAFLAQSVYICTIYMMGSSKRKAIFAAQNRN